MWTSSKIFHGTYQSQLQITKIHAGVVIISKSDENSSHKLNLAMSWHVGLGKSHQLAWLEAWNELVIGLMKKPVCQGILPQQSPLSLVWCRCGRLFRLCKIHISLLPCWLLHSPMLGSLFFAIMVHSVHFLYPHSIHCFQKSSDFNLEKQKVLS